MDDLLTYQFLCNLRHYRKATDGPVITARMGMPIYINWINNSRLPGTWKLSLRYREVNDFGDGIS